MDSAVELHDSECLAVEMDLTGNGAIILDAYVHRSDGEPCKAPGEGGMQRVRFHVESMKVVGEVSALPATIYDGLLNVGGSSLNLIPLPFESVGTCDLRLSLLDGGDFHITGKAMRITPEGDFRFVEQTNFTE